MSQLSHDIPEQMFSERAQAVTGYRAVSMWAVASLVCGCLSFLVFLDWLFVALPILGLALGFFALRRLRHLSREMIGAELALGGMAASVVLGLVGWIAGTLISNDRAPYGYAELSFEDMQPAAKAIYDPNHPGSWVPKNVLKLNGQKVFLRGYIFPTRYSTGLQNFVLIRSEGHCTQCVANISPTDKVEVTLVGELTTDYRQGKVGVGGRLKIIPEEIVNPMGGMPFTIEADCIR